MDRNHEDDVRKAINALSEAEKAVEAASVAFQQAQRHRDAAAQKAIQALTAVGRTEAIFKGTRWRVEGCSYLTIRAEPFEGLIL